MYIDELQFRKSLEREHLEKTGLYESTYEWARTTGKIQLTNKEIEEKINTYQQEIDSLTKTNEVSVIQQKVFYSSTLYDFYAVNFLNATNENLPALSLTVMFIFQIILAVFLELIPQVGIFCFLKLFRGQGFKVSREEMQVFVSTLWRKPKKTYVSHIPEKGEFMGMLEEKEKKTFTCRTYRRLTGFLEGNKIILPNARGFMFLVPQMSEREFLEVLRRVREKTIN